MNLKPLSSGRILVETFTKKVHDMKTINLFFLLVVLSLFSLSACQDETAIPEPERDIPKVRDISITEVNLQVAEDGIVALNMDIGILPGAEAPQGSFSVRIYEESRLQHTDNISLAGLPSGECCLQGKCEEVEHWTYTCDAPCDNNSRSDGCNYHRQKQVFLPLEPGATFRLVLNEEGAVQETEDAASTNNALLFTAPASLESLEPGNPNNPYDEAGRWHNEQLQALLHHMEAEPAFADWPREDQQRAVLEWSITEAMALDGGGARFSVPHFLYTYTGREDGVMREVSLEQFKIALERLEADDRNRNHLATLYHLLEEHPLEEQADIANLLAAIRALETSWIEDQDAAQVEAPLIAASIARYSLYFWAARQPVPFEGPQLFGIREGFFADAFGGGMGAALGAIGGPGGAVIGGLIGGVASSAIFAID